MDYLAPWNRLVERSVVLRFIDIYLRGAGQVMFQNNPLTGLLFLVGIAYGAAAAGTLPVLWGLLIALLVATVTAILLDLDEASIRKGLFGFNAALVGAAIPTFMTWGGALVGYIVLGAVASVIVTLALTQALGTWDAAPLTGPFVLTTWFLLLAVFQFAALSFLPSLAPAALPQPVSAAAAGLTGDNLVQGLLKGVAQVFFIDNLVTGIVFLVALLVNSGLAAAMAILGTSVGLLTAVALGADPAKVYEGLYGYNSVLSAIAVGSVFYTPGWRATGLALVDALISAVVAGALFTVLGPLGVPILTSAFVFTTWAFLLAKKSLVPRHNEPIAESLLGRQHRGEQRRR